MLRPVSMVFGPDDDVGFAMARDALLESFELWLGEKGNFAETKEADAAEMAGDAGLALDWKWSYGDGDLGRWRTGDIGEFLLEWCSTAQRPFPNSTFGRWRTTSRR